MLTLPPRYEPIHRLGAGGGGEVWSVQDRVSGRVLALKVLAPAAGKAEASALVREAVALSGLEGLGVPRVAAFGALRDGRRYLVRELVHGKSLEDVLSDTGEARSPWLPALASACDQLTIVHRAGLLHGDIKPANVIVDAEGRGTWVDLGLAAPWREGGAAPEGVTPRYAAPELLVGQPITVRAEVYALGATLADALNRRGDAVDEAARTQLAQVASRATQGLPEARWPSVDELASALRRAAGMPPSTPPADPPWPVLGFDAAAQALLDAVLGSPPGSTIALEGPRGAGRTTLARRLAWTLGAQGRAVAFIEAPQQAMAMNVSVELELRAHGTDLSSDGGAEIIVVDDADFLDAAAADVLRRAVHSGARLVVVARVERAAQFSQGAVRAFAVPALETSVAESLLQRSVPSLPDGLRAHLLERAGRRPGPLRTAVRQLSGRVLVSQEDVDLALNTGDRPSRAPGRAAGLDEADRALDRGRFDQAEEALCAVGAPVNDLERVRVGLARARVALGRGDAACSLSHLAPIEAVSAAEGSGRAWRALRARIHLRTGSHAAAAREALWVVAEQRADVLAADALSVRGVALAFTGEDAAAREALDEAIGIARTLDDPRALAVALGSSAIAHQRAGRTADARAAYEASLTAAERAEDAATVAATRLNLAGLARTEGDLAQALQHLEAAVDMGQRAGSWAVVTQARVNLANLDIYLGRWARARGLIDQLASKRNELGPAQLAQLLGLEAEHAARSAEGGSAARAAALYEEAAAAWEAQGRTRDAAESRLEGLLAQARAGLGSQTRAGLGSQATARPAADPGLLARELEAIGSALGDAGFGEHSVLAELVRGAISVLQGDEESARRALDASIDNARKAGSSEWAWQALDARARLLASQGSMATARRDTDAALAILEETAAKLPRDLREVFWDDPRRRALRQAHTATVASRGLGVLPTALSGHGVGPTGTTSIFNKAPAEDRLARVLELTRELATEHDMARLLQRVTDHAVALLGAERGFVLLTDEKGELEARTARTRAGSDDPHAVFSRSVAERVVRSNEPVVTVSARDDERLAQAVSVHQLMIQSIACVPIRAPAPLGRTLGALYVETRLRAGIRFEEEMPTLSAFADQAAIAIENARLLAENKARADDLARANAELEGARDELARALGKRTEQLAEARRDLKQVRAGLRTHFGYGGIVGTSAPMRKLYALIDRVKETDVPLLVTGESGTGKEMIARAVHQLGGRAKQPFLGLNCGAIPHDLLESELFGSVRGAFTGADRDRAGLFREAHRGTLLLDEVGEMPARMQAGLLRVLQERRVRPVGGAREEDVDVRVIAATHRDLARMVAESNFREDLYYRLHVVELRVPSLRERVEDIPLLIDHFISRFATRYRRDRKSVSRDALRKMSVYSWPGNVRQLEHVLLSAWLMTDGTDIESEDLELPLVGSRPSPALEGRPRDGSSLGPRPPGRARAETRGEHKAAERERIVGALAASNWNRAHAAKLIGVPRRTFYRRLKEFGLL